MMNDDPFKRPYWQRPATKDDVFWAFGVFIPVATLVMLVLLPRLF